MALTFDEAIEHFRNNTDISGTAVFLDDVEDTLKELRKEYAPTVEMTSHQKENLLTMKENKFSLIEIVAEFDDGNLINDFDGFYWFPMTEIQLVQAWLHPETIKIVDE